MRKAIWIDNGNGPFNNPDLSDEEFNNAIEVLKNQNLNELWQSATDFQEAQISGAAYGLVTLGIIQQKPKAIAIMDWINSVWSLYYTRKPLVTHEWNAELYDFIICGQMPYTVPELMSELGLN